MSKDMQDSMKVIKAMKQAQQLQLELNRFMQAANEIYESVDRCNLAPQQLGDYGLLRQASNVADKLQMTLNYYLETDNDWIEGELELQANGRYCLTAWDGYEFSSGSLLQYQDHEDGIWYTSRIESYDGKYYVVDMGKNADIEGLRVRVPRNRKLYF